MPDKRLDDLEKALNKAQNSGTLTQKPKAPKPASNASMASGMRAGTEFIVALVLPTVAGYFIDDWLGTKPIFMILLLFLGMGAGFMNIYKISQNLGSGVGYVKANKGLQNQDEKAKNPQLSNPLDSKVNDDP